MTEAVGSYHHERDLVTFLGEQPESYTRFARISIANVADDLSRAFAVQRVASSMTFMVNVSTDFNYDIDLSFAELLHCDRQGVDVNASANGVIIPTFNAFRAVGCNALYVASVLDVAADEAGAIVVGIDGNKNVGLATACFRRRAPGLSSPALCRQDGCSSMRGPLDYTLVHGSLALEDGSCGMRKESAATLLLPADVQVVSATLQWAASGIPFGRSTSVMFAGVNITSDFLTKHRAYHIHPAVGFAESVYTAAADVTRVVRAMHNATYSLTDMFHRGGESCHPDYSAHMAGWALVVLFERADLPLSHVNVCARYGDIVTRSSTITTECIEKFDGSSSARATVVAYEGEQNRNDTLVVNSDIMGYNLFSGLTALRMDVLSFSIDKYVSNGEDNLVFTMPNSTDGIMLPLRITYQPV